MLVIQKEIKTVEIWYYQIWLAQADGKRWSFKIFYKIITKANAWTIKDCVWGISEIHEKDV